MLERVREAVGPAIRTVPRARLAHRGYRFGRWEQIPGGATTHPPNRLSSYFDAHTEGPGIWKWRHYFEIYDRHCAAWVGNSPRVLEIGVYSGGSLPMWRHYFGEGTVVHGVDIESSCLAYATNGIRIHIGDQASPDFWESFKRQVPEVDIVVDDGGHMAHQQVPALEALLPIVSAGGVYLCEDIGGLHNRFHAYIAGLSRNLHYPVRSGERPSGFQQIVHSVHLYPFMAVIEKRREPMARMEAPRHGTVWEPFLY